VAKFCRDRKRGNGILVVLIVVPLIAGILLAVFMIYAALQKRRDGIDVTFPWETREVIELKKKLRSSFDTLSDRLKSLHNKLAEIIEEYK